MSATQKLVLIATPPSLEAPLGLDTVNDLLGKGWRVAMVTPLGGGGASEALVAAVVLERSGRAAETLMEHAQEEIDEVIEELLDGDGARSVDPPMPPQ